MKTAARRRAGTMVHEITLRGKFAERLGGPRTLRFVRGVNILCGANGSGKSTVIDAISSATGPDGADPKQVLIDVAPGKTARHDFEKDNPRLGDWGKNLMMGDTTRASIIYASRQMSHGQSTKRALTGITSSNMKNRLIMMDEPEQALDLDGLVELRDALLASKASQIIVATHAPMLILEPSFHVVEMSPDYRTCVAREVRRLAWLADQPATPATGQRRRPGVST